MAEIEKKYKINLNLKKDISLGEWLIKKGYPSLSKMLKKKEYEK